MDTNQLSEKWEVWGAAIEATGLPPAPDAALKLVEDFREACREIERLREIVRGR